MLPEDELVRRAGTWHQASGGPVRPEDVIIAAFVSLRRIAVRFFLSSYFYFSLTLTLPHNRLKQLTFSMPPRVPQTRTSIMKLFYQIVMLGSPNGMMYGVKRRKKVDSGHFLFLFVVFTTSFSAGGDKFHLSFLTFFRLYVRLFLNSFGIHPSMLPVSIIY